MMGHKDLVTGLIPFAGPTRLGRFLTISLALTLPSQAFGQESPNPAQADAPPAETAGLQDIIVTAQRRGQNLQSVPIAVSVASGEDMAKLGVRSTADIGLIAPSVTFNTGVAAGSVTVRGVGGTGSGGDEPANAIYLDGVYLPAASAAIFLFNSIERIEVLKGPQGTLFGRNASGGLVHVITQTPSFEVLARGEIGYGNYDTMRASGYFNAPLSSTVAFNVAGILEDQGEGFGKNIVTGRDAYRGKYSAVRAKLLWQPTDRTTVTAAVLASNTRPSISQDSSLLPGERSFSGDANAGFFSVNTNETGLNKIVSQNYAFTVKHDFESLILTSITSRDITKQDLIIDLDYSPLFIGTTGINAKQRSWTQEIQLSSASSSPVQWTLGAFYYDSHHQQGVISSGSLVAPLVTRRSDTVTKTKSYAAYGQATAPLGSATNFTAGLRYTVDTRELAGFLTPVPGSSVPLVPQSKTDKKVTWRLAIDHKFGERILGYASYSRGFKSGLFNATAPQLPAAEPQTADAYEVGLKTEMFDRKVRLNLAGFYNEIKGIQVRGLFPGAPAAVFYNASGANILGAEAEMDVLVSSRLSLRGSAAYLRGRYADGFTNALAFTPRTAPPFGLIQSTADASGNTTVNTPKWVASLAARYSIPTSFGEIVANGSYTYNDGYYLDPQNRVRSPAVDLVNASLEVGFHDTIKLTFWANNIADQRYYSVVNSSGFGDGYVPQLPRTYGITLGVALK